MLFYLFRFFLFVFLFSQFPHPGFSRNFCNDFCGEFLANLAVFFFLQGINNAERYINLGVL